MGGSQVTERVRKEWCSTINMRVSVGIKGEVIILYKSFMHLFGDSKGKGKGLSCRES
jgi:hypothetical protein